MLHPTRPWTRWLDLFYGWGFNLTVFSFFFCSFQSSFKRPSERTQFPFFIPWPTSSQGYILISTNIQQSDKHILFSKLSIFILNQSQSGYNSFYHFFASKSTPSCPPCQVLGIPSIRHPHTLHLMIPTSHLRYWFLPELSCSIRKTTW